MKKRTTFSSNAPKPNSFGVQLGNYSPALAIPLEGVVDLLRCPVLVLMKYYIEGVFSSHHVEALYKMSMYLQFWKPVAKRQDREKLMEVIGRIRGLVRVYRAS
jgi:hypothetical protein